MSKKQVPEDSREQQFAELRNLLLGNSVFGRQRGNMGGIIHYVASLAKNADNPTDFCQKWDAVSADTRVLGNMLSKFARDGKDEAFEALAQSLGNPQYLFPGEDVPYEKTTPVTALMFEPKRTMLMIRWVLECEVRDLYSFFQKRDNEFISLPSPIVTFTDDEGRVWRESGRTEEEAAQYTEELQERKRKTAELFAAFPSLEIACASHDPEDWDHVGSELCYAYEVDVMLKYGITWPNERQGFYGMTIRAGQVESHLNIAPFGGTIWNKLPVKVSASGMFLFLFRGDQKAALSNFTREQQEQIASWQFHVNPDLVEAPNPDQDYKFAQNTIEVGLHTEDEHAQWQYEKPGLASNGVAANMGSLFAPPLRGYRVFENSHQKSGEPFRIIFSSR